MFLGLSDIDLRSNSDRIFINMYQFTNFKIYMVLSSCDIGCTSLLLGSVYRHTIDIPADVCKCPLLCELVIYSMTLLRRNSGHYNT